MLLNSGTVRFITKNITAASRGEAIRNISVSFTDTVKAIITAPITIKGERRNRRSSIFMPVCAWSISTVIRVTRVEEPRESISLWVRVLM